MILIISHLIALAVGMVAGLLVGRKNPKVADETEAGVDRLRS